MPMQQELQDKLDLSGKGKKKKAAGTPAPKAKGGKKKRKGKAEGTGGDTPCKEVDISAFDVADLSGRYRLDLQVPAALQVPPCDDLHRCCSAT